MWGNARGPDILKYEKYANGIRPFIIRSDSELLFFFFRSEKKMGLLIMQTDFAKSDRIKSDL